MAKKISALQFQELRTSLATVGSPMLKTIPVPQTMPDDYIEKKPVSTRTAVLPDAEKETGGSKGLCLI